MGGPFSPSPGAERRAGHSFPARAGSGVRCPFPGASTCCLSDTRDSLGSVSATATTPRGSWWGVLALTLPLSPAPSLMSLLLCVGTDPPPRGAQGSSAGWGHRQDCGASGCSSGEGDSSRLRGQGVQRPWRGVGVGAVSPQQQRERAWEPSWGQQGRQTRPPASGAVPLRGPGGAPVGLRRAAGVGWGSGGQGPSWTQDPVPPSPEGLRRWAWLPACLRPSPETPRHPGLLAASGPALSPVTPSCPGLAG